MNPAFQRANTALVFVGLVGVVLPAIALHAMTAIVLLAATPILWLAYGLGWWALLSLLRIFASFVEPTVHMGPVTVLGLLAGSATVVTFLWPVFTRVSACSICNPPELLVYRPELLCVVVAAHWAFLHHKAFRLVHPSSGSPLASAELKR